MRYYRIEIGDSVFSSFEGGKNVPGALNVILDVPVYPFAVPSGAAWVQIWGIPISTISQASDFNGKSVSVYGGFQAGLPLANPTQAGLLVKGQVFQAFGNWIGTTQTLDLIIYPDAGTIGDEKNIVLNWKKGTPLSTALAEALTTAFPDLEPNVAISDDLVLPADEISYHGTLTQFATYIKGVSKEIKNDPNYFGVDIAISEDVITAYDGTTPVNPTELVFADMIGQPTWISPLSVQTKFAMRADLKVGDYIKFPPALVTASAGATSPFVNARATFQGVFQIGQVRHVGNFRQRDAASWVTVVDAYAARASK